MTWTLPQRGGFNDPRFLLFTGTTGLTEWSDRVKWRMTNGVCCLCWFMSHRNESRLSGVQAFKALLRHFFMLLVFSSACMSSCFCLCVWAPFFGPLFCDIFCRYLAVVATRPVTEMFSTPVINFSRLIRQPLIPEVKTRLRFLCSSKGSSSTPFLLLKNSYESVMDTYWIVIEPWNTKD